MVIGIKAEQDLPVKLIGVGEKMEDMQEFNPQSFVAALSGQVEDDQENDH